MDLRDPNLNEDVLAYDKLQTDEINRVGNEINDVNIGVVTRYNAVSPATGYVEVIRHGNMIFLSGEITFQTGGQRLVNIPAELCPKNGFYHTDVVLAGIQITNFGGINGWGAAGIRNLSGCSWSISNK